MCTQSKESFPLGTAPAEGAKLKVNSTA